MSSQPVKYIPGRGYNISGTGLFRDGDGLTIYATKKQAIAFARRWGWPAKYVCTVFMPLYGGYAVAQDLYSSLRFLKDDGTVLEAELIKMPYQKEQYPDDDWRKHDHVDHEAGAAYYDEIARSQ